MPYARSFSTPKRRASSPNSAIASSKSAAIEIVNRRRTGRQFHRYLCPDRDIDPGAVQVHGLTTEFLAQPAALCGRRRRSCANSSAAPNSSSTTRRSTSRSSTRSSSGWRKPRSAESLRERFLLGARHARARAADASGPAQQPRRVVQTLRHRQLAPRPARRVARCQTCCSRSISR